MKVTIDEDLEDALEELADSSDMTVSETVNSVLADALGIESDEEED